MVSYLDYFKELLDDENVQILLGEVLDDINIRLFPVLKKLDKVDINSKESKVLKEEALIIWKEIVKIKEVDIFEKGKQIIQTQSIKGEY